MRKHRTLALNSWGAYQRNGFSEPRLLHLPILRKALNSLTWCVQFSLINSNFWCSEYLVFAAKNPLFYPASSLTSLEQSLRTEPLRGCFLGLKLSKVCRIKHSPQLLSCPIFYRWQSLLSLSFFLWVSCWLLNTLRSPCSSFLFQILFLK